MTDCPKAQAVEVRLQFLFNSPNVRKANIARIGIKFPIMMAGIIR